MMRLLTAICCATAAVVFAQSPGTPARSKASLDTPQSQINQAPIKLLDFKPSDGPSGLSISPVTTMPAECSPDGTLFLDMLDVKDLRKHTVVSIKEDKTQTYSPEAIRGLNDITVVSFFPSDSLAGFLVRATTETLGPRTPGSSPAGVPWSKYHYYVAEFNRDGTYRKSVLLDVDYPLSRLAILTSGEFLVTGYDNVNSAAHLLLLDSSGQIEHEFDLPAFQRPADANAPYGSAESMNNSSRLLGYVLFTPYKEDILVWHVGSADPIMDIGAGGSFREVPLQAPPDTELVNMIPASDRWVALFRTKGLAENIPLNRKDYAWYEFSPVDGGLVAKLSEEGSNPPYSIACEKEGAYISFQRVKDDKIAMLIAR